MARRAALYLRSSKDRHDVSIESQRRELTALAEANGDVIVETFEDKVESAKTDERPQFQRMMDQVRLDPPMFSVIYCYDTSRFSRRQYHAQLYKHLLKKKAIDLIYLKLPKTDSMLDPVIESIMEIFDEFHSQKSKMDGLRGMKENVLQGWRAGGRAPTGYVLDKHIVGTREGMPVTKTKLIKCPETFDKLQAYLKDRVKGLTRRAAIRKNDLSIPYTTLANIEDRLELYCGHTVWNRANETIDGKHIGGDRNRDKSEWIINRDTHPAMITDEEAQIIERRNTERRETLRQNNEPGIRGRCTPYSLTPFLYCKCGSKLHGDQTYYRCSSRCGESGVKKETIEVTVLNYLTDTLLADETISQVYVEAKRQLNERAKRTISKRAELQLAIEKSNKEIKALVSLLSELEHKRPLLERINELEEQRSLLSNELLRLVEPTATSIVEKMTRDQVRDYLVQLTNGLSNTDATVIRALLASLISRIDYTRKRLSIHCHYLESPIEVDLPNKLPMNKKPGGKNGQPH